MKRVCLFLIFIFFAAAISVTAGVIGDVDGDWDVDLSDVISTMQVLTNLPSQSDINLSNDVNSDNVWGLPEALHDLGYLAGLRDEIVTSNVQTSYGTISGIEDGNSMAWLGIPYAAPPVGDLRWQEPQNPSPWDGTLEAINFSDSCTQFNDTDRNSITPPILRGSEDCLYLNIFRPANHEKSLPVYFYVHGGVNSIGTGNAGPYNGINLALSGNMIVVTINYRLGPFGWFNLPQLNTGKPATDSGNFGLLDTIQALKWVKVNIASFGGDPGNITIAGQSAGGQDILALLLSPFASNLFHKAIVRSGIQPYKSMSDAENHARGRLKQIMVNDFDPPFDVITTLAEATTYLSNNPEFDVAGYMRAKSNTEIMEAYEATYPNQTYTFVKDNGSLRMPTVFLDGNVIPTAGYDAFGDGTYFNKVQIILGSNLDEIKYALPFDPYFNNDPSSEPELYNAVARYGSDLWKFNTVDDLAQKITALTEPPAVFAYQFKWLGINDTNPWFPDMFGACHSSETPFFFGNEIGGYAGMSFTEDNRLGREALSAAIISYISSFVHTGSPGSGSDSNLPAWEPWTDGVSNPKVLLLDANKTQTIISTSTSVLTRESVLASMPDTTPSIRSFLEIQYPAFWLTSPTGFTAEMLDASPTYYATRSGDPDGTKNLGTTQEILVFSGTGPDYVVTITEEYFDDSDVSQGTNTFDVDITLNADGTLTASVSGDPDSTAITLTSETATYLLLHGVVGDIGDGNTWDDTWHFVKPAGWLASPLIGGWIINPDSLANSAVITFIDETNYMFAVDGEPDDGGGRGMERGTYTWNESTGAFNVTAIIGTAGDWGPSGLNDMTVTIDGNTLNIVDSVEGLIPSTKVSSEINPIVGSWIYSPCDLAISAVLTFIDDTNYMFAVDGEPDDGGGRGMERGTYKWNSSTGAFTATAISQTTGDWGISFANGWTLSINGNTLNIIDPVEGLLTLSRVVPNVCIESCSQAYAVFTSPACQKEALAALEAHDICIGQCGMVQACLDDCENTLWNSMTSCHGGWPQLFDHGGEVNEGVCGQCYLDCDDTFNACLDANNNVATCLDNLTNCAAGCS